MKTKFLHIATALLFAGFTSSCSDFLDRYPLDELSDSSFWKLLTICNHQVYPLEQN